MEDNYVPGEIEAVMVRMPMRFTHNAFFNLYTAFRIDKASRKYNKFICNEEIDGRRLKRANNYVNCVVRQISKYEPITFADGVMSQLVHIHCKKENIAKFARYLISDDMSVQCKKLGIALLGTFGHDFDVSTVVDMAENEEFTYFSVKALSRLIKDKDEYINTLAYIAQRTFGWGKIAAILDLPDTIENSDVRLFLLTNGAANNIGLYHLAVECAIKGDLKRYFETITVLNETIPVEVQKGICDIFRGLFEAEEIETADGFNEIKNIKSICKQFCQFCDNGYFTKAENAPELCSMVKDKFGF